MLIIRQYRHIKIVKRFGLGYIPEGIEKAEPGSCAVKCAACPIPGSNLPADWEQSSSPYITTSFTISLSLNISRWLYRLSLSIDANFRLSNRLRSSYEKDPGLGTGLSYFVPQAGYNEYVLQHADQEEVRAFILGAQNPFLTAI